MVNHDAWLARVRSVWNERSASWDEMSEANAVAPDRAPDLQRILTALQVGPGHRMLDAGSGSGQFAIAFAEFGLEVTGVDLAPEMIVLAQEHAMKHATPVKWRVEAVDDISDPNATYDAVFARTVLQFVPSIPEALAELRRVLKPGKRMLVSVPGALSPIYSRSWRRHVEPDGMGSNFVTPWELEEILVSSGWTVFDQWYELSESLTGETNAFAPDEVDRLPLRLKQAAATTWTFVVG